MTARAKGKRTTPPVVQVDGLVVRIVGEVPASCGRLPRRQSFAWSDNATEYAHALATAHGWRIEHRHG